MARCESLEFIRKLRKKGDTEERQLTDSGSDSDGDIDYMLNLDISGNMEENSPGSPQKITSEKEEPINHPVLSLKCLHEDTDEEHLSSKSDDDSTSKFINAYDVPELSVKSLESNKDELEDSNPEPEVENEEEHPNLEPVIEKTSSVIYYPILPVPVINVPARSNWEGIHNFKIKIDCDSGPKKSDSPVFSKPRNKLYVSKDVPFKVLVSANNVPAGSIIRMHAVFSRPEHACDTVRRCPTHAQQDYMKGNPAYEHFVQSLSDAAVYENNHKLSVYLPYENPQNGETFSTYLLKLTCFNSCTGGLNRRPFTLVFTLEKNTVPLGRQIIEAKVCACPLRDFKNENDKADKAEKNLTKQNTNNEQSLNEQESSKSTDMSQSSELAKILSAKDEKYTITVKDPELFEFLKHMKVLYEMGARHIPPDT